MSFPVAFQSAVFYFVACTPCAKVRHRQKAKDQAKKERQEKAKLEAEQPGLYRHPSPFNTNPYWQEEISMGPSLPKKSASKNSSQRGLTSSGRESSASAPSVSDRTAMADSRTHFGDAVSLSVMPEDDTVSEDWNRRRGYQREDEVLWGQPAPASGHRLMDAFSKARDSAGRLIDATLGIDKEVTEQERRDFYLSPRNPPVNDYHPPVVSSKPLHRDARKWMLQPPPPAKVMEGKVPVSRAVSTGSRSSARTLVTLATLAPDEPALGRATQERLARRRARNDDAGKPTETELIESLFATRSHRSFSYTRAATSLSVHNHDDSDEGPDGPAERRRRSRRKPRAAPPGPDSDDDDSGPDDDAGRGRHATAPPPQTAETTGHAAAGNASHAAQRPRLETIPSTDGGGGSSGAVTKKPARLQKSSRSRGRGRAWVDSPVGDDTE